MSHRHSTRDRVLARSQLGADSRAADLGVDQFGVEHHRSAGALDIAVQSGHEFVHIDDPGAGAEQARRAAHLGLQLAHLLRIEPAEIGHAVRRRLRRQLAQLLDLALLGHDDLAAAAVRDSLLSAVGVEEISPAHAQARLQAPGRIVDPGVNHPGIARGGFLAHAPVPLDDDDL